MLPGAVARFRGESSLRTLLVSIAVRHAGHHLRSAARRRSAMARFAAEPPPARPAPDEEAARRRLAAVLERALDALPIDQRVVVVLCEVEGRTSGEVARIVGAPETTVRIGGCFTPERKLGALLAGEELE